MERFDVLTPIHKGIRGLLYDLGLALQRADFDDDDAGQELIARLDHELDLLHRHGQDEELFIFPEVLRYEPELIGLVHKEHEEIDARIEEVRTISRAMDSDAGAERPQTTGRRLNQAFNSLAAFYLAHMNHEESTLLPACWQYFTDEELQIMRANILKATSPELMAEWMRWILAGVNDAEMAHMLRGMRDSVPPQMIDRAIAMARNAAGDKRWPAVAERAGLQEARASGASG